MVFLQVPSREGDVLRRTSKSAGYSEIVVCQSAWHRRPIVGVLFDFQIHFIIVVVVIMINQRHMERVLFLPFIVIVWDRCATTAGGEK